MRPDSAVSVAKKDIHSVFAKYVSSFITSVQPPLDVLSLITYYSIILLLSGLQADEARILKQYKAIV